MREKRRPGVGEKQAKVGSKPKHTSGADQGHVPNRVKKTVQVKCSLKDKLN